MVLVRHFGGGCAANPRVYFLGSAARHKHSWFSFGIGFEN
jgi:hypothetical protein